MKTSFLNFIHRSPVLSGFFDAGASDSLNQFPVKTVYNPRRLFHLYTETVEIFNERLKSDMGENSSQPLRLGVTGGAGSGKSVVCERLRSHDVSVILADELARRAVLPGMPAYEKIVENFGTGILDDDKRINRARLRQVILRDQKKKQTLESFVHPEVFRLMAEDYMAAAEAGAEVVAVEVPLLFEAGMEGYFDYILTISVDREERIRRLMARDQISREDAEALMRIQWPEEEKQKRSDYVIDNSGRIEDTIKSVDQFHQKFMARVKKT